MNDSVENALFTKSFSSLLWSKAKIINTQSSTFYEIKKIYYYIA